MGMRSLPEEDPLAKDPQFELKKFVGNLNEWRSSGGRGRPIPEPLWLEAGRLAGSYGVGAVSLAAGLNHGKIKLRMTRQHVVGNPKETKQSKELARSRAANFPFVEVPVNVLVPQGKPMVVEMRGSHGGFIRIEQANADDIVMVMQAFLGNCP